jgi:hypothetical protein
MERPITLQADGAFELPAGTPFSVVLSWNETAADLDWIGTSTSAGPVFSTKEI